MEITTVNGFTFTPNAVPIRPYEVTACFSPYDTARRRRVRTERFRTTPEWLFRLIRTTPDVPGANLWGGTDGIFAALSGGDDYRIRFTGAGFQDCMTARDYPAGRALIERYTADLATLPEAKCIRRVRRWGSDGDEFSRDRFDAGHDECWATRRREAMMVAGAGVLKVTIGMGGNCDKTAEQLAWNGAAGALLVDRLEAAGYRCEVWCVSAALSMRKSRRGEISSWEVQVKAADEPLDIDRLVLVAAHPAFFRWHVFRWWSQLDTRVDDGFGHCFANYPDELCGDVHIYGCYSFSEAQSRLNQLVASFGGEPK